MKKILLYIFVIVSILLVINVFIIPVSFDAGTCSGGFSKYISEKYAYKLGVMFVNDYKFNSVRSYNYNNYTPSIDELTQNMDWKGRSIFTSATIELDEIKYYIKYEGKRYWFETYSWKIVSIEKLN